MKPKFETSKGGQMNKFLSARFIWSLCTQEREYNSRWIISYCSIALVQDFQGRCRWQDYTTATIRVYDPCLWPLKLLFDVLVWHFILHNYKETWVYEYMVWTQRFYEHNKYLCIPSFNQCNTHMSNEGHLKFPCIWCLEFFNFHSPQNTILLCDSQMYNRRVQHIVDHVKKMQSADSNPHAWRTGLVTCSWSLKMKVEQEITWNRKIDIGRCDWNPRNQHSISCKFPISRNYWAIQNTWLYLIQNYSCAIAKVLGGIQVSQKHDWTPWLWSKFCQGKSTGLDWIEIFCCIHMVVIS